MAGIVRSCFFCISFLAAWLAVFLYPKAKRIENGVTNVFLSYLTLICFGVIPAGILSILKIPVQLWSMGIIYLLAAFALFFVIRRKGEVQKYCWEFYDFVTVALILIIVLAIAFRFFTPELKLRYWTSDAAVHLAYALDTYRDGAVFNMYFAPLYNALFVGILSPFLTEFTLYKGFMAADISMFFLEGVMFLILIRTFLKNRWMKILGFCAAVGYLLGYPLYCYTDTFLYWGIGVMLIGYLLYNIHSYMEDTMEESVVVFRMMDGCTGLILCYALFAPAAFLALFACLLIKAKRKGHIFIKGNVFLALKIFVIPCLLGVYYCYIRLLLEGAGGLSTAIATEGAIYREWYIDFFLLFPFAVFLVLYCIRRRKVNERIIFLGVFFVFTVALFFIAYKGRVSSYYYYKLYYPLWLLFWIVNVEAFALLWEKLKEMVVSVVFVYAVMALICFGNVENQMKVKMPLVVTENRANPFFALYLLNKEYLHRDWSDFEMPKEMFELAEYVGDSGEECIPFVTDIDQYSYCYWYEALTGQDSSRYYGWFHTLEEEQRFWNEDGIRQVVVWKSSSYYKENKKSFAQYDKVFENKRCVVIDVDSKTND